MRIVHLGPMILNQVELLLRIDLVDLPTDVHSSKDLVDLAHLFLEIGEDRCTLKSAANCCTPIPAMLPEDFLVAVLNKVVIGVAFGDEEDELAEEDIVFVDFFKILDRVLNTFAVLFIVGYGERDIGIRFEEGRSRT
jgi:hypothetical protein